jgi:hypothetical protein
MAYDTYEHHIDSSTCADTWETIKAVVLVPSGWHSTELPVRMLGPPDEGTRETQHIMLGIKAKSAAAAFSDALILFGISSVAITRWEPTGVCLSSATGVPLIRHLATIFVFALRTCFVAMWMISFSI